MGKETLTTIGVAALVATAVFFAVPTGGLSIAALGGVFFVTAAGAAAGAFVLTGIVVGGFTGAFGGLMGSGISGAGAGISGGGITSDVGSQAQRGFSAVSGDGFARTSTSPQSVIPIVFGNAIVYGTFLDYFLLGENNQRLFAVVGLAQGTVILNEPLIDSKPFSNIPTFNATPGNPVESWYQFQPNGVASGDIELVNSGKKNVNVSGFNGDIITTLELRFFNVTTTDDEARVFISVDVPGVVQDFLETNAADYTALDARNLDVDITASSQTFYFSNAYETVGANYAGLNGKSLQINHRTGSAFLVFGVGAVDAATTAAEITANFAPDIVATAVGVEVRVVASDLIARIDSFAGSSAGQLNFVVNTFGHTAATAVANITAQISGGTAAVVNVDEIQITNTDDNNKLLEITGGTAEVQLNFIVSRNYGTFITYDLKIKERDSDTFTTVASDTDVDMSFLDGSGAPQTVTLLMEAAGNFYTDVSIPGAGDWAFVLDINRADNGARVGISTVEVMSDKEETVDASYSGLNGLTTNLDVNGDSQTVTYTAGAVNATGVVSDINDQIGSVVTASVVGTEVRVEATARPEGTKSLLEIKDLRVLDTGTAASLLNFTPIFATQENYRFKNTSYIILNVIKNQAISNNPRFQFEVTGKTSNPATGLLAIYSDDPLFQNIGEEEMDRESFEDSADFCDDNGFEINVAILDTDYGSTIEAFRKAGSLITFRTGGKYKCIPETDSQAVADFNDQDHMIPGSFSWGFIEDRQRYNRQRVSYVEKEELYTLQDIILEDIEQIDDDGYVREQTISLAAVTDVEKAYQLGDQLFKKQNLVNIWMEFQIGIKDTYVEVGDIITVTMQIPVEVDGEVTLFNKKKVRILEINETDNFGYTLRVVEHIPEVYAQTLIPAPHDWHPNG